MFVKGSCVSMDMLVWTKVKVKVLNHSQGGRGAIPHPLQFFFFSCLSLSVSKYQRSPVVLHGRGDIALLAFWAFLYISLSLFALF